MRQGSIFQSNSDTEVVLHLYARSKARSVEDAIVESVAQIQGAFSLVMQTKDQLIAVRDPHARRVAFIALVGDVHMRPVRRITYVGHDLRAVLQPGQGREVTVAATNLARP